MMLFGVLARAQVALMMLVQHKQLMMMIRLPVKQQPMLQVAQDIVHMMMIAIMTEAVGPNWLLP